MYGIGELESSMMPNHLYSKFGMQFGNSTITLTQYKFNTNIIYLIMVQYICKGNILPASEILTRGFKSE